MIFTDMSWPIVQPRTILTIGNFDGLHLGHKSLLKSMQDYGMKTTVLTFWPNPKGFFDQGFLPLNTLEEKIYNLKNFSVDQVLVLEFNQNLASMHQVDFIEEIIIKKINPAQIVIGEDFRFGKNAAGNAVYLQNYLQGKIKVEIIKVQEKSIYSSSRARTELQKGNIAELTSLLGSPYRLIGIARKIDESIILERELNLNMPDMKFIADIIDLENGLSYKLNSYIKNTIFYISTSSLEILDRKLLLSII